MKIDISTYGSDRMIQFADGDLKWFTGAELARFDIPEGAYVAAIMVTLDAPEGGITQEWREAMGAALVDSTPRATSWDTLDESDDRDISEFVIDMEEV